MRNQKIDELLKQAIVEDAEEQGRIWEAEPAAEPVPELSQARFDAAMDNAKTASSRLTGTRDAGKAQPAFRPLSRRLLTYGLAAVSCAALVLIVSVLLRTGGIRRPVEENLPAAAVPSAATPQPEEPAPTQWTGNGHWYTYQPLLPTGVKDSANQMYLALYEPYFVMAENPVAIGRVKGVPKEVKMYTNDPEERIIWTYTDMDVFYGTFLREGVQLPKPDPESCDYALCNWGETELILSGAAKAELLVLMNELEQNGETVLFDELQLQSIAPISYVFRDSEIQDLRYLLQTPGMARYDGRVVLMTWENGLHQGQPNRMIGVDPESALYREYCAWEEILAESMDQQQ